MDPNISNVADFVLRVREQDSLLFGILLTALIGTIFGGILIASIKKEGAEKGDSKRSIIFALFAFGFFMIAIFCMRVKHNARGEFCMKWMANNAAVQSTPKELIGKFSKDYYSFIVPGEPNYPCDSNNIPKIWLGQGMQTMWGHFLGIDMCFVAAFVCFLIAMSLPLEKTQSVTTNKAFTEPDLLLLEKATNTLVKVINLLKGLS